MQALTSTSKRITIEGRVDKSLVVPFQEDGRTKELLDVIIVRRDGHRVSMTFYGEAFDTGRRVIQVGNSYRFRGGYGKIRSAYSLSTISVDVGFNKYCAIDVASSPIENEVTVGKLADVDLEDVACIC